MFKKAVIVNAPTTEDYHYQYLSIDFTDGTFVNLTEEELKNAAHHIGKLHYHKALVEKGRLHA